MKNVLAFALLATSLQAEDWPQFRGNNGSGVSASKNIPLEFSADKNIAWKAQLGDGVGSAIVKNGVVYATGMAGKWRQMKDTPGDWGFDEWLTDPSGTFSIYPNGTVYLLPGKALDFNAAPSYTLSFSVTQRLEATPFV
jgi:hypothetical protein